MCYWSTDIDTAQKFRYCCFDHCTKTTNWYMVQGKAASLDGVHMISDLGDAGDCDPRSGSCQIHQQALVWDKTQFRRICPFVKSGHHNATFSKDHVVIDDMQSAFSFMKKILGTDVHTVPCLAPDDVRVTDQGVALRLVHTTSAGYNLWYRRYTFSTPISTPPFNESTNNNNSEPTNEPASDPINVKLEFLMNKLVEDEQKSFRTVWIALCQLAQRQLDFV
ncbi:MAG: hypothetical protein GY820_47730, partial [Gammaproteobacteria bacterium]|nr:hypothetical protein [Gammaproteobacteria bacterium]